MTSKSRALGPGHMKIGETGTAREFASQLTKAALNTNTKSDDPVDVLSGGQVAGEDTYTHTLTGTLLQDYDLDSLELYCFDNRGRELPFVFIPSTEGEVQWSGTVKIRPVSRVGGDVKKKNDTDFEFAIIGDPTHGELVA
ncbi:hypothetical protein [Leifsonia sp. WHRI 6310E]|uniref:hypothetical protein n=1 Tax=Leifsonia sp. WHRI 6310E TaxID=3162562 RepID=UPI0032F0561A